MEPDEYQKLEEIAARQHVSVSELFRSAVRERYFTTRSDKQRAVDSIAGMRIELPEWPELKREIQEAKNGGIH